MASSSYEIINFVKSKFCLHGNNSIYSNSPVLNFQKLYSLKWHMKSCWQRFEVYKNEQDHKTAQAMLMFMRVIALWYILIPYKTDFGKAVIFFFLLIFVKERKGLFRSKAKDSPKKSSF